MLGIFKGKQGRAWDEYQACVEYRHKRITEFRQGAIIEVLSLYPDAIFLIGNYYDSFLAYSKNYGIILRGHFNDQFFPRLEYLNKNESYIKIQEAIRLFEKKLKYYTPMTIRLFSKYIENENLYYSNMRDPRREDLFSKGYVLDKPIQANLLMSASVSINDSEIAMLNCFERKEDDYFLKNIYESYVSNENAITGRSSVFKFNLIFSNNFKYIYLPYEMICDNTASFTIENKIKFFKTYLSQASYFMASIEESLISDIYEFDNEEYLHYKRSFE